MSVHSCPCAWRLARAFALGASIGLFSLAVPAAVLTWIPPGPGDWFEAANWSSDSPPPANAVPERLDDAVVLNGGQVTISTTDPLVEVLRLSVGAGSSGNPAGTVIVDQVPFEVLIGTSVGAATDDAMSASGTLSSVAADLGPGGSSFRVGTANSLNNAGVVVTGVADIDGTLRTAFPSVGTANDAMDAQVQGSLRANDLDFRVFASIGTTGFGDPGQRAEGTVTVTTGDLLFSMPGGLTVGSALDGTAIGTVLVENGALSGPSDLSVGTATNGTATGTVTIPRAVAWTGGLSNRVNIGTASNTGVAMGTVRIGSGDLLVEDVVVGSVLTSATGPSATGVFELGGVVTGDGANAFFDVARSSAVLSDTTGTVMGTVMVDGVQNFRTVHVAYGTGSTNITNTTPDLTGVLTVGAGGVTANPAATSPAIRIGHTVVGGNADATMVVNGGDVTGFDLEVGHGDVGGQATGRMTINEGTVSLRSTTIGLGGRLSNPIAGSNGVGIGELTINQGDLLTSGTFYIGAAFRGSGTGTVNLNDTSATLNHLSIGFAVTFDPSFADGTLNLSNSQVEITDSSLHGFSNSGSGEAHAAMNLTEGSVYSQQGALNAQNLTMNVSGSQVVTSDDFSVDRFSTGTVSTLSLSDGSRLQVGGDFNLAKDSVGGISSLTLTDSTLDVSGTGFLGFRNFGGAGEGRIEATSSELRFGSTLNVGGTNDNTDGNGFLVLEDSSLSVAGDLNIGGDGGFGQPTSGMLSVQRSLVNTQALRFGTGGSIAMHIGGFASGETYGAVETDVAEVDGTFEAVFDFVPVFPSFDFDVIVTGGAAGLTGAFTGLTTTALGVNFQATNAPGTAEVDGETVAVFRVGLRPDVQGGPVLGCTDATPTAGADVTCSATDENGVSAAPRSTGVTIELDASTSMTTPITALHVHDRSAINAGGQVSTTGDSAAGLAASGAGNQLDNDGDVSTVGSDAPAIIAYGDDNAIVNASALRTSGASSPGIAVDGAGNQITNRGHIETTGSNSPGIATSFLDDHAAQETTVISNRAGARVTSAAAPAVQGFDGVEILNNAGSLEGGAGTAVDLAGGDDVLQLEEGFGFVGAVLGGAGRDRLVLSGGSTVSFDLSAIGDGQTFRGFETFAKEGDGTWRITGTGTGDWQVAAGELAIDGQLMGGVEVLAGALLSGVGSADSVDVSGSFSPGASIGTFTVTGDYVHRADGTLVIEIDDQGNSDRVEVGGRASIEGGTLSVRAGSGQYSIGQRYEFLTARGGVTGRFATVVDDFAFATAVAQYEAASIDIVLARNATEFSDIARTYNQRSVAGALSTADSTANAGFADAIASVATMDADSARAAYDALSGELHGSAHRHVDFNATRFVDSLVSLGSRGDAQSPLHSFAGAAMQVAPLRATPVSGSRASTVVDTGSDADFVWFAPYGYFGRTQGDGNAAKSDYKGGGISGGVHLQFSEGWRAGVALDVGTAEVDLATGRDASADLDFSQAAIYVGHAGSAHGWVAAITAGNTSTDARRTITFGTVDQQARADYDADHWTLSVAGHAHVPRWSRSGWKIGPAAGLSLSRIDREGFVESGAGGLNLAVRREVIHGGRTSLGLRAEGEYGDDAASGVIRPYISVAWQRQWLDDSAPVRARFTGDDKAIQFPVQGVRAARDAAVIDVHVDATVQSNWRLRAGYRGELNRDETLHAFGVSAHLRW